MYSIISKFLFILSICYFSVTEAGCRKSSSGSGSGSGSGTDPVIYATISDIVQERTPSSSQFHFSIVLQKASTKAITILYKTADGTAFGNADYTPVNGTLTIPAGELKGSIDVTVKGDSLRKDDQYFFVQLDSAKNCVLSPSRAIGTITNSNGTYLPVANTGYTTPTNYPGYALVWSDEFSGKVVDSTNWTFETGNNNGWGNNELEYYTGRTQNEFVSSGNLILEARPESIGGYSYSSARMISKNKRVFKYGRVDIRAKLPTGQGIWPALWMLGNNIDVAAWPSCGEMDIMELVGKDPNIVYATMHWGSTIPLHKQLGTNFKLGSGTFDQQFHVFSLIWKQDDVRVLVDDQEYLHFTPTDVASSGSPYPFNNPSFFIFNVAVGGYWPGSPSNATGFPQRMIVDYIRMFQ